MTRLPRIAFALACACALNAHADPKLKVAVRSFAARGVAPSDASTLETSFCTALSHQSFDVLCPDEVKALIAAKQVSLGLGTCETDEACIRQIASVSDAARIVTGEVSKLGETYILSVTLIDAKSGLVLARASEKTKKIDDLLDKTEELAKKLAATK